MRVGMLLVMVGGAPSRSACAVVPGVSGACASDWLSSTMACSAASSAAQNITGRPPTHVKNKNNHTTEHERSRTIETSAANIPVVATAMAAAADDDEEYCDMGEVEGRSVVGKVTASGSGT
jgi:hypothetical protein